MRVILGFILCFLTAGSVSADSPPAYERLRQNENWSAWCQDNLNSEYSYKCLRPIKDSLLSVGGEGRWRYAIMNGANWQDKTDASDGAFFQRYVLFADLRLSPSFRLYTQLYSALSSGLEQGPSPLDENELSFQQAFFQFSGDESWQLTVGRQELALGSGRLVDAREGANVRRRYDSLRLVLQVKSWQINTFVGRPWQTSQGSFDDRLDHNQALWGIYAVSNEDSWHKFDMYYLGYRNNEARYFQGAGEELRHTLGSRLWGTSGDLTLNWEAMLQFGRFNNQDIRAWSLAADTSIALELYPFSSAGVSANIASGDKNQDDNKLGTFNPMFPRGNYFSELAILGPRNFYNIQPYLSFQPYSAVKVTAAVNFYWRLSTKDGVYGPGGNLLNTDSSSDRRYVATEYSLSTTLSLTKSTALTLVYGRSVPAALVQQTGSRGATDYVEFTAKVLF
ncbi:alginate export family protein [Rheinheimera sp. 1928-s]|uniref:alginate export family protein n=1 Tax=Rheinheimera sp. 1928-s TaxID=3033803 RepID=UPI0026336E19|nr:alginate export family protein [Rheinheimera sp. 1928-s]MDF3124379.1 alginate export family protein [Rheinheimera sp. 1928-s]